MKAIQAFGRSSSFSLSLIFTSLLMLGVVFITYFLIIAQGDTLIKESKAAIEADTNGLNAIYNLAGINALVSTIENRAALENTNFFYHLRDKQGKPLAGNLRVWPNATSQASEYVDNGTLQIVNITSSDLQAFTNKQSNTHTEYHLLASTVYFPSGETLFVGRNVSDIQQARWIGNTFGWGMIAILCLVAVISMWVAYYVVNRINTISEKADDIIATGNLSARLPVDSNWDDLSKLTISLNHMLDQIEQSILSIKSVSDNIAHDLRTPLTRLKQHIEQLPNQQEKISLVAESDNLLSIFNSLLRIADIEADKQKSAFDIHNLGTIVEDVIDLYSPIADEKNISLYTSIEDVDISCDKNLIFQAFANVLDNAIKFTPIKGSISVQLHLISSDINDVESNRTEAVFKVLDSGRGVSTEEIEQLTRRFYRADKSRTTKGNGLGLSLVNAIVLLHEGKLSFSMNPLNEKNGLGVIIRLQ